MLKTQLNSCIYKRQNHLNFDIYSFIKILENQFYLMPFIIDRMCWILKKIFDDYSHLIPQINFENAILAVMLFSTKESGFDCYENIDISHFISCLYKKTDIKKNIIQIYAVFQTVTDLFSQIETQISQADEYVRKYYN